MEILPRHTVEVNTVGENALLFLKYGKSHKRAGSA